MRASFDLSEKGAVNVKEDEEKRNPNRSIEVRA